MSDKKKEEKKEDTAPRRRSFGRGRRRSETQPSPDEGPSATAAAASIVTARATTEPPSEVQEVARGKPARRTMPQKEEGKRTPGKVSPVSTDNGNGSPERQLTEDLQKLKIDHFASRPGFGTAGRPISLLTNHFLLKYPDELVIYHYNVELKHERFVLNRDEKRMAFWEVVNANPQIFLSVNCIGYDGVKTFFSLNKLRLPNGAPRGNFEVMLRTPRENFESRIFAMVTFVSEVHIDMRAIQLSNLHEEQYVTPLQFLDVICQQARSLHGTCLKLDDWYPFGSSTYMVPDPRRPRQPPLDLGGGCQMWPGIFTSAHVGQVYRPLLNIDVAHGTFYHNERFPVLQFLVEVLNDSVKRGKVPYDVKQLKPTTKLTKDEAAIFRKAISGCRVRITHRPQIVREFRVNKTFGTAAETTFLNEQDDVMESVASYFARRYGALKYPSLPLLHVGSKTKTTYLPIEHCYLAYPQRCTKKLSENQLTTLIRATAIPAPDRRAKILSLMQEAKLDEDPWLRTYGIKVGKEMIKVVGRVLPPPQVEYDSAGCRSSEGPIVTPKNGEWSTENQKVFQAGTPVTCYGLMIPHKTPQDIARPVFRALNRIGNSMGVQFAPDAKEFMFYKDDPSDFDFERQLTELLKKLEPNANNLRFVFVILEKKGGPLYAEVKRCAEIVTGTMTQCMLKKNVQTVTEGPGSSKAQAICRNLLLKVNAKMGGINWRLYPDGLWKSITNQSSCTLFVGANVSHPPPFDTRTPSIGAVVSNVDLAATRYTASIKVQKRRRQAIMSLYEPVRERLLAFYSETKVKPSRLIFYRNGVADSQFRRVFVTELADIREACASLEAGYRPKVTFIITMKRHHTRFFCIDRSDETGRGRNVPPGTMVDKEITSPQVFDFYLCSHLGIQGTSRPMRYTVLFDENGFKTDELQAISYCLANVYCRCPRSVSIPTPVYYAHWACLRAQYHLINKVASFGSDIMSTTGDEASIPEQELIAGVTVTEQLRGEMYFV